MTYLGHCVLGKAGEVLSHRPQVRPGAGLGHRVGEAGEVLPLRVGRVQGVVRGRASVAEEGHVTPNRLGSICNDLGNRTVWERGRLLSVSCVTSLMYVVARG